jgi:uncharacterized repeat protein (TIGR01451 family)
LSIAASDAPDPAFVGGSVTYTLTVSNFGDLTADNVVVKDVLPATANLVSATAGQGSCTGVAPVTCSLGTLNGFSIATVTIVVTPIATGDISNTATVSTSSFDPVKSDNTAASVTTVGIASAGLQGRIDLANPGETILVAPGTYVGALDFGGKDVTLQSTGGPAVTVIRVSGGTAVRIGPGGAIKGFTITGAVAFFGAAIEVHGTGTLISGNIFDGNVQLAGGFGAAIGGNVASPTIERNLFRNNSCDNQFDAGVVTFVNGSSQRIVNNVFANNPCRALVIFTPVGNPAEVLNNTFVGNRAAIRLDRFTDFGEVYRNNILVGNNIGVEVDPGELSAMPADWTNNLVFGNTVANYQVVPDQTGIGGNLSVDPQFVNQAAGNYDLQAGSPAINKGSDVGAPALDFDGVQRVSPVDIGAFEGP